MKVWVKDEKVSMLVPVHFVFYCVFFPDFCVLRCPPTKTPMNACPDIVPPACDRDVRFFWQHMLRTLGSHKYHHRRQNWPLPSLRDPRIGKTFAPDLVQKNPQLRGNGYLLIISFCNLDNLSCSFSVHIHLLCFSTSSSGSMMLLRPAFHRYPIMKE